MKSRWRLAVGLAIAFLMLSLIIACAFARNPLYVYTNGAIEVGGDGEPIELINNATAGNPTCAQLITFIKADTTDMEGYSEKGFSGIGGLEPYNPHVCADFAESVHNNAETAGIRAAWVSIDFAGEKIGHALNAFETTDKGLVFIDCTGGNPLGILEKIQAGARNLLEGRGPSPKPISWDAIAYVEIGKEYGLIPLDSAEQLSYQFYQEYKK